MQVVLGKLNGVFLQTLLNQSAAKSRVIRAAVAYAQASNPLFEHCRRRPGVRLIYYGLLDEDGAVAPHLLRSFLDQGPSRVDCRLVRGSYHPKVVWWEGYGAYIGSANLTQAAWSKNVECGVFYPEREMEDLGIDAQLDAMFEYLGEHSVALTAELVVKLETLANERGGLAESQKRFRERFDALLSGVPEHAGVTTVPAKGAKPNVAQRAFIREWTDTLQKLRGLSTEFIALNKHPKWVARDAHPAVHFDQFLHAYYYEYVRGGLDEEQDDDDDAGSAALVERSFERHKGNPGVALREAAQWWSKLAEAPYGEDDFIESTGPRMAKQFSKSALESMNAKALREAIGSVNAFRMHARQMKNDFYDLPVGHREDIERRVDRLAQWLWSSPDARTSAGKNVRDVLLFVVWGAGDMEQRLWLATHDPAWSIQHLGKSTLGEAVGWARPDEFPPRNNRTNKALRALGHDVKLF